jgi:hypothetical protein
LVAPQWTHLPDSLRKSIYGDRHDNNNRRNIMPQQLQQRTSKKWDQFVDIHDDNALGF